MDCPLVSHDESLRSIASYPAPLLALPTPWPFEYVDAQELGIQDGKDSYQLPDARILAPAP